MIDRIRYGKIVEEGDLTSEKRQEYKDLFSNYNSVQVTVIHSYCAVPPIAPYIHSRKDETLKGELSWETLESIIEEINPSNDPLDKIPFFFRHRKKPRKDFVEIIASGNHLLGSHHIFRGVIISKK